MFGPSTTIWLQVWHVGLESLRVIAIGMYQVLLLQICGISLGIVFLNTIGCTSTQYNSIDSSATLTSTTQRSDSSILTIASRYPLCYPHLLLLSPVFLGSFKHHPIVRQWYTCWRRCMVCVWKMRHDWTQKMMGSVVVFSHTFSLKHINN